MNSAMSIWKRSPSQGGQRESFGQARRMLAARARRGQSQLKGGQMKEKKREFGFGAKTDSTLQVRYELPLEKFIEYVEAVIRDQCSDLLEEHSHELKLPHEGAAMMLAWFGLASLDEDVDGLIWRAGRLALPLPFKD